MQVKIYPNFSQAIKEAGETIRTCAPHAYDTGKWQSVSTTDRPEMAMHEVYDLAFKVPIGNLFDTGYYANDIGPNLEWANAHFEERVCGKPINPGIEWANWPYGHSAKNHLEDGMFNHNYMERYWPRFSLAKREPTFTPEGFDKAVSSSDNYLEMNMGLNHVYGDLGDVVNHLKDNPGTRQAILPIWFPEDTNSQNTGRKPCSMYHKFFMRHGYFHHSYHIRSCDFKRHFRDDIYLALKLHGWVLESLRQCDDMWKQVVPGFFTMHIDNLHVFANDYREL